MGRRGKHNAHLLLGKDVGDPPKQIRGNGFLEGNDKAANPGEDPVRMLPRTRYTRSSVETEARVVHLEPSGAKIGTVPQAG